MTQQELVKSLDSLYTIRVLGENNNYRLHISTHILDGSVKWGVLSKMEGKIYFFNNIDKALEFTQCLDEWAKEE